MIPHAGLTEVSRMSSLGKLPVVWKPEALTTCFPHSPHIIAV